MMSNTDNEALADNAGVLMSSSSQTPTLPTKKTKGGLCTLCTTKNKRKMALLVFAVMLALVVVPIAIALTVLRPFASTQPSTQPFASKSPTQGSNIATGRLAVDGAGTSSYVLLDWTMRLDWDTMSQFFVEGAPQILLLDDLTDGDHGSEEHSSTDYSWAFGYGYASNNGSIVYEYNTNTTKDQQVLFSIDGFLYNVSKGGLFLIQTAGGVEVQQVDVAMPDFYESDDVNDAVQAFAESNNDILAFLKEIS
jgi:hypothetical protein